MAGSRPTFMTGLDQHTDPTIPIMRSFPGYFRLALAQKSMQKFDAALETIKKGLTVDFGNNDLKTMRKEVRARGCV